MDKIGVYICKGCGIGDALDSDALSKVAKGEYKVPVCTQHEMLCGKDGAELIKADIDKGDVNGAVIAACSPRVMFDVFDFGPNAMIERVNLREQVVWCHPTGDRSQQARRRQHVLFPRGLSCAGKESVARLRASFQSGSGSDMASAGSGHRSCDLLSTDGHSRDSGIDLDS